LKHSPLKFLHSPATETMAGSVFRPQEPRALTWVGFIFILSFLLFPISSFAVPADIKDISDGKYFQAVHDQLSGAKDSIYIAMYEISIDLDKTESEAYKLVQDIVDAHARGVKVEVYLDRTKTYDEDKNDSAFLALYRKGVPVRFITPGKRVHDKLIVISGDEEISCKRDFYHKD